MPSRAFPSCAGSSDPAASEGAQRTLVIAPIAAGTAQQDQGHGLLLGVPSPLVKAERLLDVLDAFREVGLLDAQAAEREKGAGFGARCVRVAREFQAAEEAPLGFRQVAAHEVGVAEVQHAAGRERFQAAGVRKVGGLGGVPRRGRGIAVVGLDAA
jgi:hypothetical protein